MFKGLGKTTTPKASQTAIDTAAAQADSRYVLDVSEVSTLSRFFSSLSAPKSALSLMGATYRTESVYRPLVQRVTENDEAVEKLPSLAMKITAATQIVTLQAKFIGKSTGKDGKDATYTFDLGRFVEHGDDLRLVVEAAKNIKKRKKRFPDNAIPSDELITKLETFHKDFMRRKEAISRGMNPDTVDVLPSPEAPAPTTPEL